MKNKKHAIRILLSIGLLACFFTGCKTSKNAGIEEVTLEKMSKEIRFNQILQSGMQYTKLSSNLRFTLAAKDKREISIEAQLRIIKNEAIQISFLAPVLRSEVIKLIVTPRQVILIDRMNKQYLQEDVQTFLNKLPVDFDYYNLEAILTNRIFITGKRDVLWDDYSYFDIQQNSYDVRLSHNDKQNIQYNFITDQANRIQSLQVNKARQETRLTCNYTGWELTSDKINFPMLMKFSLDIPDKSVNVNLAFKSINTGVNFSIDDKIPNKYRRMTLQQVTSMIKRLL
ncbi:MAG: DUF4292 domain-containing protein [Dysgonamonadaceae bacterium]|jgi:hypothetical protein|nr:DUF4292 domain-containing protein [Dysgonamonadaceae bacterium]